MENIINVKAYLWALGVVQPARPTEVHDFLKYINRSEKEIYDESSIKEVIEYALNNHFIEKVSKKNNLFILSSYGAEFLGKRLRLLRDKNRLLLLKALRNDILKKEGLFEQNLDGDSPSPMFRSTSKVAPRPEESLSPGPLPQNQRFFWPRVSEQLKIGSFSEGPSNFHPINLNYYSKNKLDSASNLSPVNVISELIGISPRLISSMVKSQDKHYRTFSMPKKSGGYRKINSPRAFLKTVQYWIGDYFLYRLVNHENCFSYKKGVSVKDNASVHLGKKYILCMDIDSYFDCINVHSVFKLFVRSGIDEGLSDLMSKLVTLNGTLPQGSPVSPLISNSYLYDFDVFISDFCSSYNITYSRYSDDLTFGGDDKSDLEAIIGIVKKSLSEFNLNIKDNKTRLLSENNTQIVTGVAINNGVLRPSRRFRKTVRAIFHNALVTESVGSILMLSGYLHYLKSFESGETPHNIRAYEDIIEKLKSKYVSV